MQAPTPPPTGHEEFTSMGEEGTAMVAGASASEARYRGAEELPTYTATSTSTDMNYMTPTSSQDYADLPPQSQGVISYPLSVPRQSSLTSPSPYRDDYYQSPHQSSQEDRQGSKVGYSTTSLYADSRSSSKNAQKCQILPSHIAVWIVREKMFKLSALAAEVLFSDDILKPSDVDLIPHTADPSNPFSGIAGATRNIVEDVVMGVADYPIAAYQSITLAKSDPARKMNISPFTADKGVARIFKASIRSPMTITMALTHGFNNAPKLYHDTTVRKAPTVTGVGSGLKAASKGLGLGVYDGVTGIFMQPINGARTGGSAGFAKGVGKGIGGVFLKPVAGACSVPGYMFLGVYKGIQKIAGHPEESEENERMARMAQGREEAGNITQAEKEKIIELWRYL